MYKFCLSIFTLSVIFFSSCEKQEPDIDASVALNFYHLIVEHKSEIDPSNFNNVMKIPEIKKFSDKYDLASEKNTLKLNKEIEVLINRKVAKLESKEKKHLNSALNNRAHPCTGRYQVQEAMDFVTVRTISYTCLICGAAAGLIRFNDRMDKWCECIEAYYNEPCNW